MGMFLQKRGGEECYRRGQPVCLQHLVGARVTPLPFLCSRIILEQSEGTRWVLVCSSSQCDAMYREVNLAVLVLPWIDCQSVWVCDRAILY
ncbi:unnamed protein product [Protopolystoma xenopodis]|uniref:Uncharacterized protein n=1 Tax=Protopolystoma xenopodis TaxID=117903 RepID=A0A3S5C1Z7_9PLAT|nr:unnamed protein product [Protopolystoma xenopodis]